MYCTFLVDNKNIFHLSCHNLSSLYHKQVRKEIPVYQIKYGLTALEEYVYSKLGNLSSKIKFCFLKGNYEIKMTISVFVQDYSNMTLTIGTDVGKHTKGHSWDISTANAYIIVLNYLSYLICVSIKFYFRNNNKRQI